MYDENNDGTMMRRESTSDVEVRRTWNDDGKPKFLSKNHRFPLVVNFTDENGEKKPIYREEE